MCIGMIDTVSSCDDVELVELNSMVELVSVSGGESEGPVSPPQSQEYCTHGPAQRLDVAKPHIAGVSCPGGIAGPPIPRELNPCSRHLPGGRMRPLGSGNRGCYD